MKDHGLPNKKPSKKFPRKWKLRKSLTFSTKIQLSKVLKLFMDIFHRPLALLSHQLNSAKLSCPSEVTLTHMMRYLRKRGTTSKLESWSWLLRGHSTTTWTKSCPILITCSSGQLWTFFKYLNKNWTQLLTSFCPHS